jgi:uncharacterized protein (TIGR03435 family)
LEGVGRLLGEGLFMALRARLTIFLVALVLCSGFVAAQTPAVPSGIEGQWQGTLQLSGGRQLRIVLKVSRAADGSLTALNYSIDQSPQPMRTADVSLHGNVFHYAVPSLGNSYEGKLSADGNSITGNWAQTTPLNFARATKETAWEIPQPALPLKPMTEQNPSFAVATIKPSNPSDSTMYIRVMGRRYVTHGTSLVQLIQVAYGVNDKQIVGAPAWAFEERFDMVGEPDAEGEPNAKQWLTMLQKLITERFALTMHHEQREISSYVLTTGKDGVKNLTPSESNSPLPSGLEFLKVEGGLLLPARNTSMAQLGQMLQQVVLDRPVVDHTGLTGRYDFELRFMPNETMFHGHPPIIAQGGATEPDLYEAMSRLGLKLSVEKTPLDVIVVDHVQRPSEN